jgi:hypothetical protein
LACVFFGTFRYISFVTKLPNMFVVEIAGSPYEFFLSRNVSQQELSLCLVPLLQGPGGAGDSWDRQLYELQEALDSHFYPIAPGILFKPVFPGNEGLLEIKIHLGGSPLEEVSALLRSELMADFKRRHWQPM